MSRHLVLVSLLVATACAPGGGNSDGGGGGSGGGGRTGGTGGAGGGAGGGGGGGATCLAGSFLQTVGRSRVLVGGAFEDAQATASWDARYQYLAGSIADGAGPCASCASGCTAGGANCSNSGAGCNWWGCWQYDVPPPGDFARSFVSRAKARGQLPMLTYYVLLQASGLAEGTPEVAAVNDQAFLGRYFNDFRFLLQQIGSEVALVHLEPDFWGYAQHLNPNPHLTPARVTQANATDCAAQENSVAGFGRCLVSMVRRYAPNAKVGFHASSWASRIDVLTNRSSTLDVVAEANKVADFLRECGAAEADYLAIDPLDRDAGYYQVVRREDRWWDVTNTTLPHFRQAFTWSRALAERLGRAIVWWQIPIGNSSGNDTPNHYRDNRVDYLMAHVDEAARAHVAGLFFGAGAGDQTTAATDNGNLLAKVNAYRSAGGQAPCP